MQARQFNCIWAFPQNVQPDEDVKKVMFNLTIYFKKILLKVNCNGEMEKYT